jgi:3',5'-cyclic-AMP phosphodiesterase
MAEDRLTRREFLRGGALTLGAAAVTGCANFGPSSTTDSGHRTAEHVLRIAHLTDMHVLPNTIAKEGLARAIRHAQSLDPQADLVLNTGDCIMDSLTARKEDALAQWSAFREVFEAECSLPVVHCIGNHDVWGWGLKDPLLESDPLYGKGMALQQLELPQRFFSFDQAGWHFILLDSTHLPVIPGSDIPYAGMLDEEQFLWFEQDLEATPSDTPVCVASHIPFVTVCEYFDGPNEQTGNWVVPGAWMHIDARRMRSLFLDHANVRLCLSGHAHQHERLEYLGVKYLCDGAVSGNWWSGDYMDFPPAYVVVDLFSDGSSEHTFIAYDQA